MLIVFPLFAIGIGSIVLAIMTAVSASKYPDWAFQQTGTSKFVWLGLPIIFIFLCNIVGGVMGLIWFTSKREVVERVAQSGGPPPPYGAPGWQAPPPGSWGPPGGPPPGYPQGYPPSPPQGYPPAPGPPPAPPGPPAQ